MKREEIEKWMIKTKIHLLAIQETKITENQHEKKQHFQDGHEDDEVRLVHA